MSKQLLDGIALGLGDALLICGGLCLCVFLVAWLWKTTMDYALYIFGKATSTSVAVFWEMHRQKLFRWQKK